jgi:hypothetical protein
VRLLLKAKTAGSKRSKLETRKISDGATRRASLGARLAPAVIGRSLVGMLTQTLKITKTLWLHKIKIPLLEIGEKWGTPLSFY